MKDTYSDGDFLNGRSPGWREYVVELRTARAERDRRRKVQRVYREHFTECTCSAGCARCAHTGLVSKGEARINADSFSQSADAVAMP
jgi:hypothetical protein